MSTAVLYRNNWQGRYLKGGIGTGANDNGVVSFMTMHASKGLEFDCVIVAGICDGIIPDADNASKRSGGSCTWPAPGRVMNCTLSPTLMIRAK